MLNDLIISKTATWFVLRLPKAKLMLDVVSIFWTGFVKASILEMRKVSCRMWVLRVALFIVDIKQMSYLSEIVQTSYLLIHVEADFDLNELSI